jgi:hypothetical protein
MEGIGRRISVHSWLWAEARPYLKKKQKSKRLGMGHM